MRRSSFQLFSLFLAALMLSRSGSTTVAAQTHGPDITGDGKVDVMDALVLAAAFDSRPDSPNWNPNADLNGDGSVDIMDAIILSNNYDRWMSRVGRSIACLQWFEQKKQHPYNSLDADISLENLKYAIPSCNYLQISCHLDTSGDVVEPLTANETLDTAVQKANHYGHKIIFRIKHNGTTEFVPGNKSAWFSSFTEAVAYYARRAEALRVEGFCFGVEFTALETSENNGYWSTLIDEIRSVYHGKLWYETNNWLYTSGTVNRLEQKLNLTWFSKLDYIAVSAYWAVANHTEPTVQELVYGWSHFRNVQDHGPENPVEDMRNLSEAFNKSIIIVSGLWSAEGACTHPWNSNKSASANISLTEQANWYEALFEVFYNKTWVAGFEFDMAWCTKPDHEVTNEPYIIRKPAQDIVKSWFDK